LSNGTVKTRVPDMACDIKSQLIENIKASLMFGIQLDESVDSVNYSQLMVIFRYIHKYAIKKLGKVGYSRRCFAFSATAT